MTTLEMPYNPFGPDGAKALAEAVKFDSKARHSSAKARRARPPLKQRTALPMELPPARAAASVPPPVVGFPGWGTILRRRIGHEAPRAGAPAP